MKTEMRIAFALLLAAYAVAEDTPDPCDAATFNKAVCPPKSTECKPWAKTLRRASVLYERKVIVKGKTCTQTYCELVTTAQAAAMDATTCEAAPGDQEFCVAAETQPKAGSKKRLKVGMTKAGQLLAVADLDADPKAKDAPSDDLCEWGEDEVTLLETPSFAIRGHFAKRVPALLVIGADEEAKKATKQRRIEKGVYYYQLRQIKVEVYNATGDLGQAMAFDVDEMDSMKADYDLDAGGAVESADETADVLAGPESGTNTAEDVGTKLRIRRAKPDGTLVKGGNPAGTLVEGDNPAGTLVEGDNPDATLVEGDKPDGSGGKPERKGGKPDGSGGKPERKGGKPDGKGGKGGKRKKGKKAKISLTVASKENRKLMKMSISVGKGAKAKCIFTMMKLADKSDFKTIFFKCNIAKMMLDDATGVLADGGCPSGERNAKMISENLSEAIEEIKAATTRVRREASDVMTELQNNESPEITTATKVAVEDAAADDIAVVVTPPETTPPTLGPAPGPGEVNNDSGTDKIVASEAEGEDEKSGAPMAVVAAFVIATLMAI